MHHHLVLLITTNNSVILDPIQKIHFYLFTSQIKLGVDSGLVVSAHTQCFNLYVQRYMIILCAASFFIKFI